MSQRAHRPDHDPLDASALERHAEAGTVHRVIEAWWPLRAELAAGDERDRARLSVLRALRRHLSVIALDASMLFPCVYNQARWDGHPDAEPFYSARSGSFVSSREGDEPLVASLLERWRERRAMSVRASPWARSLRPPRHRGGGALIEEYRGELPRETSVRFSADGGAVGMIGEGERIAWSRRTGRRLEAAEIERLFPPSAPASRYRLERVDWGRCRLHQAGGPAIEVKVDDDASLDVHAELPSGGVLLAGWWGDYDGVVVRVDPPFKKVRWRFEGGSNIQRVMAVAGGSLVLASSGSTVFVLDAETGEVKVKVRSEAFDLALDPSGSMLALRGLGVVRLWDLDELARAPSPERLFCDEGWVNAAFSPDGARLLTGELLSDARSGRIVAALRLDGPGYLEGGPPRRARRLADGRFVEMSPMRGVQVWSTERGELATSDRDRRYSGGRSEIEIAPDGLTYVHHRNPVSNEREGGADLLRVDDGVLLARLHLEGPGVVRYSPDSSLLFVGSERGLSGLWAVPSGRLVARIDAHEGRVLDAAFSLDGGLLLTGGADRFLRLFSGEGELVGERPMGPEVEHPESFRLDDEQLERLEGWLGFRARGCGLEARWAGGLFEIVRSATGERVARLVADDMQLVPDGNGERWACRSAHFALEPR